MKQQWEERFDEKFVDDDGYGGTKIKAGIYTQQIRSFIASELSQAKAERTEEIVKHLDGIWDSLLPKPMMLAPSEQRALLSDFANGVLRYMDSLHLKESEKV